MSARHESDARTATEAHLQSGHDTPDVRCFQIRDDDEIPVRPSAVGEQHTHPAANRQSPRRFREGIEQKSRDRVTAATVVVCVVATRHATRAIELEPHVGAERNVDPRAGLQRSIRRRARIDRVGPQLERRKHASRGPLRARNRRERESKHRECGSESLAMYASEH